MYNQIETIRKDFEIRTNGESDEIVRKDGTEFPVWTMSELGIEQVLHGVTKARVYPAGSCVMVDLFKGKRYQGCIFGAKEVKSGGDHDIYVMKG